MNPVKVLMRHKFLCFAIVAALGAGAILYWHDGLRAQETLSPEDQDSLQHARSLSRAFRRAAETALPTVVTIETRAAAPEMPGSEGDNPFEGTPFEEFFDDPRFDGRGFGAPVPQTGMGSGVIIDSSGVILTNRHVVADADEVIVRLHNGQEYVGGNIRSDSDTDLAILEIQVDESLPAASLGDSDELEIGDWVIAVGNPFGLDSTVSAGIISGKGRELGEQMRRSFIQTDAAINPGNSGGPLLNLDGEVVGINTAIATNNGSYQGVGFAIPSNLARWVVDQLRDTGVVHRAYLGVRMGPIDARLARTLGLRPGVGLIVAEVLPGTPAADAGLVPDDVITHFAGVPVNRPRDLQELVERSELDSTQELTVIRDGETISVPVVLRALPSDDTLLAGPTEGPSGNGEGVRDEATGISVADVSPAQARQLGLEQGAVVIDDVERGSLADLVGLRPGMLILKVGSNQIENSEQFEEAMSEESLARGIRMLVRTRNGNQFIVLQSR